MLLSQYSQPGIDWHPCCKTSWRADQSSSSLLVFLGSWCCVCVPYALCAHVFQRKMGKGLLQLESRPLASLWMLTQLWVCSPIHLFSRTCRWPWNLTFEEPLLHTEAWGSCDWILQSWSYVICDVLLYFLSLEPEAMCFDVSAGGLLPCFFFLLFYLQLLVRMEADLHFILFYPWVDAGLTQLIIWPKGEEIRWSFSSLPRCVLL